MIKPTYVNPSRRDLLKKLAALGAITLTGSFASQMMTSCVSPQSKKRSIAGVSKEEETYESLRKSMVPIHNVANRYPDIIVAPKTEAEIVACLDFAKENDLQIVCRTSGHNTAGAVLRNGGMLMNIEAFNNFTIDPEKKIASIQPSVRFKSIVPELKKHQLGFPFGDCGDVAFGGYILGGGLGKNGNHYTKGPACYALLSADVMLASGEKITVNRNECNDVFWAMRGCGPAFFGIITKYTIQLFEPLGARVSKDFSFPLEELEAKIDFFDKRMHLKDDRVETRISLIHDPDKQGELFIRVSISALTLKGEKALEEAERLVQVYVDEGVWEGALSKNESKTAEVDFEFFYYPPDFRTNTDNAYTDDAKAILAIVDHFRNKPDCMISMSLSHYAQMHPFRKDACYSPHGKHFINYHVNWMDASLDVAALNWMKEAESILKPYCKGHYINQTDNANFPEHIEACFSKENWSKLLAVREKYDPESRFFSYLGQA